MAGLGKRVVGWLFTLEDSLLAALVLLSSVTIFVMVITRYVFAYSDASAENIARYLAIWGTLIGLATAHRRGFNIRFSMLEHILPPMARKVWETLINLACLGFCIFLGWAGWELIAETRMLGEVMQTGFPLPLWIPRAAVALGALLLAIEYALDIDRIWSGNGDGRPAHGGL